MTNSKNIDSQEIDKFSELAVHWWDPEGELKTLHQINPLRLQYIQERVELPGKKLIDLGCGGGILSESLAKAGAEVTGVDMSRSALEIAELHSLESQIPVRYVLSTAEEIAELEAGHYDVVTCMEMLEHVPDPRAVIAAAAQLLKPGGQIFFSTLNRNFRAYLMAIVGAEYILKLLPKNTHDYAKFIRPAELAEWARAVGLLAKDLTGLHYNPLSKIFTLKADVSVNYLFYGRKE